MLDFIDSVPRIGFSFNDLEKHRSVLLKYAYSLCSNRDSSHDLVQDTFERAIVRARHFKSEGKDPHNDLLRWLLIILKNRSKDLVRSHNRGQRVFAAINIAHRNNNTHGNALPYLLLQEIFNFVNGMSEKDKQIFYMAMLKGYSNVETADLLDTPPKIIRSRIHRTRERIKKFQEGENSRLA